MDLLNSDIADAVARSIVDDKVDLEASQLGLTLWSPSEKKRFFEALSRLGIGRGGRDRPEGQDEERT